MNGASRLRSNLALLLTSGLSELAARFARCHFIMIRSRQNLGVRQTTTIAHRMPTPGALTEITRAWTLPLGDPLRVARSG